MDSPQPQSTSPIRQIARAAGTVMFAMLLSQLAGLVSNSLLGSTFGASLESDAYFASNRFTEILFNLMAGGALGSAFIPTFTGLLEEEKRARAWKLASSIANLLLLVLTLVSILSWIFARPIVEYVLTRGFEDPQQIALTAHLLRIQLPSSIIFGLSGLIMGILNAHQHFFLPALAPAMYRLGIIFGTLVLSPGMGIDGVAWGVVLGSSLHLMVQVPRLLRLPQRTYALSLGLEIPEVREVGRLMAPRLLGVAVVQLNFLFNTFLASYLPVGSITALTLAFPLMIMPEAAIAQATAIAALPTFSAQVARGKLSEMRSSLAATLRGVLLLAIPASVGLILLRVPLVDMIYGRAAFDQRDAQMVAWALLWYAAGLVGHSVVEIVSRAFYALHDTKTPVFVGVGAMGLNLVFSLLFSYGFAQLGWMPHGGLALANSLATALETILLLVLMRRRLQGLEGRQILGSVGKAALAVCGMGGTLWAWLAMTRQTGALITTLGGVAVGGLVYLLLLFLLRVDEIQHGLAVVQRFVAARWKR
jgi:putative peptidoglycan lipid II flippase